MADTTDSATAPETHSFKELRRQYETSIARAKLEFAESGDNDKLWPGINERQDERDEAIFAALQDIEPTEIGEVRELLKIIAMFLEEKNQLGLTCEEIESTIVLVQNANRGLSNVQHAESVARRNEADRARQGGVQ